VTASELAGMINTWMETLHIAEGNELSIDKRGLNLIQNTRVVLLERELYLGKVEYTHRHMLEQLVPRTILDYQFFFTALLFYSSLLTTIIIPDIFSSLG